MLNKLILRAFLSISLALSFAGAANATLISQDILFDSAITTEVDYKKIGFISIDTTNAEVFDVYGDQSLMLGSVTEWVDFTFYNFDFWTQAEDDAALANDPGALPMFGFFDATFDLDNISAGIESLNFSVIENRFDFYAFNGYIDTFGGEALDIFNVDAGLHDFGDLAFGKATAVPTPATLVLFLTAVAGLVVRRKNH